jgi:hypothetical protein
VRLAFASLAKKAVRRKRNVSFQWLRGKHVFSSDYFCLNQKRICNKKNRFPVNRIKCAENNNADR